MTTTATVTILGVLSAAGFTAAAALPQSTGEVPWKDVAGGGAALLLLVALVVFLRFLSQERSARDAERAADRELVKAVSSQFTATVDRAAETHRTIHQECHASHRAREEALHELIKEHLRKTP